MGATFVNRSPFAVSVKKRVALCREFPFHRCSEARAYVEQLGRAGHQATLKQLETTVQLVYRERGYRPFVHTFDSREEAENAASVIRAQRVQKVYVDYGESWRYTSAKLITRYINEECAKHQGVESERYRLQALLRNADPAFDPTHDPASEPGKSGRNRRRGALVRHAAWLNKPFAWVKPTDIEEYIEERLEQVSPATVDRELDLLAQVYNTAIRTWRIKVAEHPMQGVRRPRYFNERDRRLHAGEEARLLAAARDEESPYVEVAILLALDTAMRRSETLSFRAGWVDAEQHCIHLPLTKNGRPRNVALMTRSLALIAQLPVPAGDQPLVAISENALKLAWYRVLARAGIADLRFHDLRHEAISRLAESGKFSLLDLQQISGHRDIRMLQRYAHLCTAKLAERMDEALEPRTREYVHRGRRRVARVGVVNGESATAPQALGASAARGKPGPESSKVHVGAARGANVVVLPRRRRASSRSATRTRAGRRRPEASPSSPTRPTI